MRCAVVNHNNDVSHMWKRIFDWNFSQTVIREEKRQGTNLMWGTRKTKTITTQDVLIIQSQKTTEYSREPKQKQANGAQVIEITAYKDE